MEKDDYTIFIEFSAPQRCGCGGYVCLTSLTCQPNFIRRKDGYIHDNDNALSKVTCFHLSNFFPFNQNTLTQLD